MEDMGNLGLGYNISILLNKANFLKAFKKK